MAIAGSEEVADASGFVAAGDLRPLGDLRGLDAGGGGVKFLHGLLEVDGVFLPTVVVVGLGVEALEGPWNLRRLALDLMERAVVVVEDLREWDLAVEDGSLEVLEPLEETEAGGELIKSWQGVNVFDVVLLFLWVQGVRGCVNLAPGGWLVFDAVVVAEGIAVEVRVAVDWGLSVHPCGDAVTVVGDELLHLP